MRRLLIGCVFTGCLWVYVTGSAGAAEEVDLQAITRIRVEALQNSQVMNTLSYLTDVAGPRLTGSPNLRRANEWARDQLSSWGLVNSRLEPWGEFGRGWAMKKVAIELVKPYYFPLIGYPKAWTRGTGGIVKGKPIRVTLNSEEDFEKYRGSLAGAIVMMAEARETAIGFEPDARRHSEESLRELTQAPLGPARGRRSDRRGQFAEKIRRFLEQEGVAVAVEPGRGGYGTVFVGRGGSYRMEEGLGVPSVVLSAEHYGRILRILEKEEVPIELRVQIETEVFEEDLQGYNVVAEIPGTDELLREELVMLGAHIDSWHSGTGATDNAAGTAVAMEVVRVLKAIGAQPRRTIRIGLWGGEEQGLLGSRKFVKKHFGEKENPTPDHAKFAGYFNLDNGAGRIRGVYLQGNDSVRPIFAKWLEPLHDLGATTLAIRNTGGTDHLAFDEVGLPGFQFIQDPVAYNTRTHHSNMDVYDSVVEEDLKQASAVMAVFVYNAAMRDGKLPRKPQIPVQTVD